MLANTTPLRTKTASVLLSLLHNEPDARIRRYRRGDAILHSFIDHKNAYIVIAGFVKVFAIESSGTIKVSHIHASGELFPIESLVDKPEFNSGDSEFEAMTDCTVLWVPQKTIWRLLIERRDLPQIVLEQVIQQGLLGVAWARDLSYRHVRERLAYRLLYMGHQFGSKADNGVIMLPDFNQMQIAETINMTRESVNREMQCLARRGIIAHPGTRIIILNVAELSKLAAVESDSLT